MAKTKRTSVAADDAAAPRPAGLKRRRADDNAPTRSSTRTAARASIAKMKEIADDEVAFEEEEQEIIAAKEERIKEIDIAKMEPEDLVADEELPIVAPGFRLWETESKLMVRGGQAVELTKVGKSEAKFSRILDIQYPESFKLVPLVITQGPYQGRHVFMVEPESGGFRFMDLPPELRVLIYSFLVEHDGPINMSTAKRPNHPRRPIRVEMQKRSSCKKKTDDEDDDLGIVSLLSISKQISEEAAPVLYGNKFSFYEVPDLKCFLETIGRMRKHLRSISITNALHRRGPGSPLMGLGDAVGLRTFAVDHRLACSKSAGAYWRWNTTTSDFVHSVAPVLRALRANSQPTKREVLNIVRIRWKRCTTCAKSVPGFPADTECDQHPSNHPWMSSPCEVICKDLGLHCVKLQRDIRTCIAAQLGIKPGNKTAKTGEVDAEADDERALKETEIS